MAFLPLVDDPRLITIDADLLPTLSAFKWRLGSYRSIQQIRPYALSRTGDNRQWPTRVYLARLITGAGEHQMVQHRDGDRLNCRRSNLRVVCALGPERKEAGRAATPQSYDLADLDLALIW